MNTKRTLEIVRSYIEYGEHPDGELQPPYISVYGGWTLCCNAREHEDPKRLGLMRLMREAAERHIEYGEEDEMRAALVGLKRLTAKIEKELKKGAIPRCNK